jgi:putative hydrolase of the HAD superfamily
MVEISGNLVVMKSVIFDLGQVLVPFDFHRAYAKMETFSGLPAAEVRRRINATDLYRRFECGLIAPQDFADEICSLLGASIGFGDFCDLWTSIFLPDTSISDVFIEGLASNYRLVLLSNTNVIHFEMVRATYPLLRHFREFVLSYEVGVMKPEPLIYQKAIAAAGCRPDECVFIDDIEENVIAARREGIDAVHFLSGEQIQGELRKRGIVSVTP